MSVDILSLQRSLGNQAIQRRLAPQRQVTQLAQNPARQQENHTGLPDNLKAGIEALSGVSLDDVQVHSHSLKTCGSPGIGLYGGLTYLSGAGPGTAPTT